VFVRKKNNNNKIVVIILFTTGFNVQKFSVFPKVCIYFIVIIRDSDDFPLNNERNNLHNRSGVFSMRKTI
jgi:hypothetical protein